MGVSRPLASSTLPFGGSEKRNVSTTSTPRLKGTEGVGFTESTLAAWFSGTTEMSTEKGKHLKRVAPGPRKWLFDGRNQRNHVQTMVKPCETH